MTNDMNREAMLDRLCEVVAAYGSDRARWPDADRLRLGAFAMSDERARTMLREARAMDQLLAVADDSDVVATPADLLLGDKVTAAIAEAGNAAVAETRAPATADIVSLEQRRRRATAPTKPAPVPRGAEDGQFWVAVAALAASLVLGVFVGATGYVDLTGSGLIELAGASAEVGETLNTYDGFGPVEEDYL